jgi:hypothetical protein
MMNGVTEPGGRKIGGTTLDKSAAAVAQSRLLIAEEMALWSALWRRRLWRRRSILGNAAVQCDEEKEHGTSLEDGRSEACLARDCTVVSLLVDTTSSS